MFFLGILLKIYKLIRYMNSYIFKYIIYIRYIFYFSMLLQVIMLSNFPPLHWMTWLSFQSSRIAFSLSSQPPPIVSPGPSSSLPQLILFVRMSTHGLHQSSLSTCNAVPQGSRREWSNRQEEAARFTGLGTDTGRASFPLYFKGHSSHRVCPNSRRSGTQPPSLCGR